MTNELYKVHRPKKLKDVIGQDATVAQLKSFLGAGELPHTIIFAGPSGTGKTTLCRILQHVLHCEESDFEEINAADARGIDMVRDIRKVIDLAPLSGGECRIWLIDEAHKLTPDAQTAFLKLLEDTPAHVYFFLATTDPSKLQKTIHTRSTRLDLVSLNATDLATLIDNICEKEEEEISEEVREKLIECAEGSARQALVLLNQILGIDEEQQLNILIPPTAHRQAIELCRILLKPRSKSQWKAVADLLNQIEEEPERMRHMILTYSMKVLLGGGPAASRAATLIDAFRDNFFDSRKAGFALACWDVVNRQ